MTTTDMADVWLEQSRQANTPEAETALLTQILNPANQDQAWEKLAQAQDCPALFRCAAIDRYVQKQGKEAAGLLKTLVSNDEPDEEVRAVVIQWLADLKAQTHLERVGLQIEDWRKLAQADSSERVRWLATLED